MQRKEFFCNVNASADHFCELTAILRRAFYIGNLEP